MKAVVIERYGGVEELVMKEVPVPEINQDQVLIEMHATSVNPYDWKVRNGSLKDMVPFRFPIILGWDAAGVIVKKGSAVERFAVGDWVFSRPRTSNKGTYAEFLATEERMLAWIPRRLSFEEAASVPLAALTAWQCLVDFGKVQPGQKVLIHAGGGGVGSLAIQLARYLGAYVATTGSQRSRDAIQRWDPDVFIDYEKLDFAERLRGYDFVLDTVGGDVQTRSYRVIRPGGRLVSIVHLPDWKEAASFGVEAGFHLLKPNGQQLSVLAELFQQGHLRPWVGQVFDFSEEGLRHAHLLSESHRAQGKIVIKIR